MARDRKQRARPPALGFARGPPSYDPPMEELQRGLERAASLVTDYRSGLPSARVGPNASREDVRRSLVSVLPDDPTPLDELLDELVSAAEPGLMASAGPRYFGFVVGGSLDAALAAEIVAAGWDQVAFNEAASPAALALRGRGRGVAQGAARPARGRVGRVRDGRTGGQHRRARRRALAGPPAAGWDVGRDGLTRRAAVRVVAGAERHATIDRALRLLGLGERSLVEVPATPARRDGRRRRSPTRAAARPRQGRRSCARRRAT